MSSELVPVSNKVATIRDLFVKSKSQIKMALPRAIDPDRMIRIAMTSIQKNKQLLNCSPQSLIGAVIQSAQLGLEPDGVLGHAYLVPYGEVCTFIVGYKGLLQLARRSGEISTIYAEVVYSDDPVFEYELGTNTHLRHVPAENQEGEFRAAYAVCKLKDGGYQFTVMGKGAIEKIRARSKAGKSGPWVTDFDEMAKKTVLRRLCKVLPCSVELEKAVALDERAEIGLPQDIEFELEHQPGPKPASKLEALTEQLASASKVVHGEHVDAYAPSVEDFELCDAEDWKDIETVALDAKCKMTKVITHIMGTMGIAPAERLPKARKGEVISWINAQRKPS